MPPLSIALIDDEKNIRRSFEIMFNAQPHRLNTFGSGEDFLKSLPRETPDIVFLDVQLPGMDGIEILKILKEKVPGCSVVMISGHATLSTAVEATRAGAYDFLEKPLQKEKLLLTIQRLQEHRQLRIRFDDLQKQVDQEYRMIGDSPAIQKVFRQIEKVAPTDAKVLISGESGVGKELIAYAIHRGSKRSKGPFIKMNCAAIPESLTESELFGNEKGAYTGATERRDGKFLQADGGTFFLDEIGDMSSQVQTKVLRVLQDGEFQRVGGRETLKVDVRIVAATNRDLQEMVAEGKFREDLFFRLNVLPITVPPLRERQDDIRLLVDYFVHRYCQRNHRAMPKIDEAVLKALAKYSWPGNIRELQNVVERLIILADTQEIMLEDLPSFVFQTAPVKEHIEPGSRSLQEVRDLAEKAYIEQCLERSGGNVSQAARMMNIERTNLHKKIKALGIR